MSDSLIASYRLMVFSTLKIFRDKVVIERLFGLSSITIPVEKIAAVENSILQGIIIETTGGQKKTFLPWNDLKRKSIVNNILSLKSG